MVRTRTTTACLLLAALAIGGCRTRLPVDAPPARALAEHEPAAPSAQPGSLTAFLHGRATAERTSSDPLRPFLAEVQTDRLQDMVRMELLTDPRRGPFHFLTACACVCVPGRDE